MKGGRRADILEPVRNQPVDDLKDVVQGMGVNMQPSLGMSSVDGGAHLKPGRVAWAKMEDGGTWRTDSRAVRMTELQER